jgi:Protein of unknown function (DUF2844)
MNRKRNLPSAPAADRPQGFLSYCLKAALSTSLGLIMATTPVWATLGQSEASVTSDQLQMKSEHRVQSLQGYKIHELTAANGATVREYVSPQGSVFGVSWQGRSAPDMNQVLGTYVNNLQTATPDQTKIQPRRGIIVKTKDFVYSNFCRMRMCGGSAYVPSLVPSNVSVEVLR